LRRSFPKVAPDQGRPEGWSGMGAIFSHAWQRSIGTLSMTIVWVCTGLFVLVAILNVTGAASRQQTLVLLGLSYEGLVNRLYLHQVITAPLMHAGIGHLLFNMLTVWMLGPSVEAGLGIRRYIVLTVLSAGAGMAGFLLLAAPGGITLGYSGAIFGILVAQALMFPEHRLLMFWVFPIKMKYAVLLFGAMELYLTVTPQPDGVSHAAHLFGAVAALAYLGGPGLLKKLFKKRHKKSAVNSPGVSRRSKRKRNVIKEIPRRL